MDELYLPRSGKDKDPTLDIAIGKNIKNKDFFEILGINKSQLPDAYNIQSQALVQCRKHKKKRVNKKWIKKYGYKWKTVTIRGWHIKNNTDGTIEFMGE